MEFLRPYALIGLLVVPLLLVLQWWQRRRRRKTAYRFSDVSLIKAAMPKRGNWKRHIPAALFLAGLGILPAAAARPHLSVSVPIDQTSIILAMDVSRSMCAVDVDPNRLAASQVAARKFVADQPKGTKIGLVAFSGFAELVVPPTDDRKQLTAAIDGFVTSRGTAIGSATLKSIDAIASVNPDVAPVREGEVEELPEDFEPVGPEDRPARPAATPPPEGTEFISDIIVVLTDGANTRGVDPIEAAKVAVNRKIRVFTIGFGTTEPTELVCEPSQVGTFDPDFTPGSGRFDPTLGGGGGGGGGAFRRFLVIDEPTLTDVATMTGGKFFKAENAEELVGVFEDLPRRLELQKRRVEGTAVVAGAAGLLALLGLYLSLRWNRGTT